CVAQLATSKLAGSVAPATKAWRSSTIWPPSRSSAQPASVAWARLGTARRKSARTIRSIGSPLAARRGQDRDWHIGTAKPAGKQAEARAGGARRQLHGDQGSPITGKMT